jgi:WD40 repeat protein
MSAVAPRVAHSPFKGLTPFDDSDLDAVLFFGREREREVIAANLLASRLTVLYGASGVGKSSVLRAGVAHHLRGLARRNLETRGHPEFAVVVFDGWTHDPLAGLLDAVERELEEVFGDLAPHERAETPAETLDDWTNRLDCDLLLVLDQAEEYFLYHEFEEGPDTFAGELPELVTRPGLRVSTLLAIRDDALSQLDRFKGRIPNLFSNYLRLDHLDRRAGRAAVLGPIEQYNALVPTAERASIEPELVEALLEQTTRGRVDLGQRGRGVVRRPGTRVLIEAPYLQLVLQRLWEEERSHGSRVLRLQTLDRLGGANEVVRTHLERALAELDPQEKDVAADLFQHLVTPSGTKIAFGLHDLAEYAHVQEDELEPIVSRLVHERILRPVAKPANGVASSEPAPVEIFHDVLGEAVLAWRGAYESDRRVAREREESDRRHRRVLAILVVAFLALGAMTTIAAYALDKRNEANVQAANARHQATLAEQAQQRAEDEAAKSKKAEAEAVESEHVANEARKQAEASEAEANEQRQKADASAADATQQAAEATRQKGIAQDQKRVADAQRRAAVRNAHEAHRSRLVALESFRRERRAKNRALAGEFTARAREALATDPVQSLQYGLKAAALESNPAIESVLRDALLQQRLLAILQGGSPLARAIFSPDGASIATAGEGGDARIFSTNPIRMVQRLDHGQKIRAIAFSPKSDVVATGAEDGSIRLWDRQTWFSYKALGHDAPVTSVEFSPDGRLLASASEDASVRIWDVASELLLREFETPNGLRSAKFSPDSRLVITAPIVLDRYAHVFDVTDGREVAKLEHGGAATSAQFSPDGTTVVTTGRRNVFVWNRATWRLRYPPLTGHVAALRGASFSADSRRVVTYSDDSFARIWRLSNGDLLATLPGHDNEITDAQFRPDGNSIVTASTDVTARIWAGDSGEFRVVLAGHKEEVVSAAFDPSGKTILTASRDRTARLWRPEFEPQLAELGKHVGGANDVAASADGRFVASAGADGLVRVYRALGGLVKEFRVPGRATVVLFTGDGKLLVATTDDGTLAFWRVRDWRLVRTLHHGSPVRFAAVSRDGGRLVTGADDRTVKAWGTRSSPLRVFEHPGNITGVDLDRSGQVTLSSGADGTAIAWSIPTGVKLHVFRHDERVSQAVFSPNGSLVATSSGDRTARLWRTSSGELVHTLSGNPDGLSAIAFSRDGKQVVTAGEDGQLRTWRVSDGIRLATFRGHVSIVTQVQFSPDGRWVVSAGPSAAGLWVAKTGQRVYFLRGHGAPLTAAVFAKNSRRIFTSGPDGTVRTYLCDEVCGSLPELRKKARQRLNAIVQVPRPAP